MSALFGSRLASLRKILRRKNITAFLVTDINNIRYLTGFSGSAGFLFITETAHCFVTDFRYREQSEQEVTGWDILMEKGNRINTIRNLCRNNGTRTIGFEDSASFALYRQLSRYGLSLIATEQLIEQLRTIKTPPEIDLIQKAVVRAEAALRDVKPFIREGARERDIAARLSDRLSRLGCRHIPFEIIVASGHQSALPHAKPTDKKLAKGDLVIIDWGGEADGYCSDMTRTFLIRGPHTGRQRELYRTVLDANRKAISSVTPGIRSVQIDRAARSFIRDAGYGEYFGHGTGHGVGLQVHELPRISWNRSVPIRENMVFTIEPGIYVPGLGGVRIEDMVVVRAVQPQVLTSLTKELEILP
jgi:Xaa-Pro aminopeptidase